MREKCVLEESGEVDVSKASSVAAGVALRPISGESSM